MIVLSWKAFTVKLDRMHKYLQANIGSNYDGMVASVDDLRVMFINQPTQSESDIVNNYWSGLTEQGESTPNQDEIAAQYTEIIRAARNYGEQLSIEFATNNVMNGITQAGKTKIVADYLKDLSYYLSTGSLYEAIHEIDSLIANTVPENLSPYVTTTILNEYKIKIQNYLA